MVKCADCGFLTLRDNTTGLLVEVEDDYRVSGRVPPIDAYRSYHNYPICFAMACDLLPEVEQAAQKQFVEDGNDWGEYVLEVITKERDCPTADKAIRYTKYQQGFTPKEHREMIDWERMSKLEEKRRKEDKRFRIIELIVLGVIAVIVAGGFTVLGAYIERGSLP